MRITDPSKEEPNSPVNYFRTISQKATPDEVSEIRRTMNAMLTQYLKDTGSL